LIKFITYKTNKVPYKTNKVYFTLLGASKSYVLD